MKEKIIIIGVVLSGFLIFNTIKESRANEAEITQRLYAQAIEEIKNGDRDHGCRVLHEAFAHSTFINDNWKTYNQIWNVGTLACNWTLRPDTMDTSSQKS